MTLWDWKACVYYRLRCLFPFSLVKKAEDKNIRLLLAGLPSGVADILDIGTGSGELLPLLKFGTNIIAADASLTMLHQARDKQIGSLVAANCFALTFKENAFDLVTAIGLAEYQQNLSRFLFELNRVTKPGGQIILTFSPKCFLNRLRVLAGHRLWLWTWSEFRKTLTDIGLELQHYTTSMIQYQLLLKKNQ